MKRTVFFRSLSAFASKEKRGELREKRTRRISLSRAIVVVVAMAGLLLTTSLASASVTSKAATSHSTASIKPDYSYYAGKTLTWLVPAGATGYTADWARTESTVLGSILHATVIPNYMTVGSIPGQDILGHSTPDGLTFGFVSFATYILDLADGIQGINFPLLKTEFIGSSGPGFYVLMGCDKPSITSFQQIATSTTPVQVDQPNVIVGTGLMSDMLTDMYGYPHTYIRSFSSASLEPGCEQGDGTFAINSIPNWTNAAGTGFQPGATPLMTGTPLPGGKTAPIYPALRGVPTLAQFIKKYPPKKSPIGSLAYKTVVGFLANSTPVNAVILPAGVPKNIAAALRDAFQKAFKSPAVKAITLADYQPYENFTPQQMFAWIRANLKDVPRLKTILDRP